MVYRLPPVRRCLVTAAEWWVTSGDGWAVAPLAVAGLALMAAVVAVVLLRWEVARLDREAADLSTDYARERDATRRVAVLLERGMTRDAVRATLHAIGGPAWRSAVDRALARRGPTGTQASAPPRQPADLA